MKYIDDISSIAIDTSFEDLREHYRTGRAIYISGTGRDKKYGYRTGVQTNLGDIKFSVWTAAMHRLIQSSGEEDLYLALLAYVTERIPWCQTKRDREHEALELHACRVFEKSDLEGLCHVPHAVSAKGLLCKQGGWSQWPRNTNMAL